jgi:hypothetical protein
MIMDGDPAGVPSEGSRFASVSEPVETEFVCFVELFFVHIETGDGWRGVQELRDFLAQCHLSDQNLNAFLHRQGRVKETKIHRSSIQSGGGAIGWFHGHGSG